MLSWWMAGWAAEVDLTCETYREWALGQIDGADVLLVECSDGSRMRAEVRWRGPKGDIVSLLPHAEAWSPALEHPALQGGALTYVLLEGIDSPYEGPRATGWVATIDPATHQFAARPMESFAIQLAVDEQRLTARELAGAWAARRSATSQADRLAAGDRIVGAAIEWNTERMGPLERRESRASALAPAFRDAAVADHRAGRDRQAADRVLALFAQGTGGDISVFEYKAMEELGIDGGLDLDLKDDATVEVVNDLGFLLDLGGEHAAAAMVLRKVVEARPTGRPVAHLNYADALWNLSNAEASRWYVSYLQQLGKEGNPVRRAHKRADSRPPPPKPAPNDAEARFRAALAAGDLELARGAAVTGGFRPWERLEWWRVGASEIESRLARGDVEAVGPILIWLSGWSTLDGDDLWPEPKVPRELRALALRVADVPGAEWFVGRVLGYPQTAEEALAVARVRPHYGEGGGYQKVLKLGGGEMVVGLSGGTRLCAHLLSGDERKDRCSDDPPSKHEQFSWTHTSCSREEWPCFGVTARAGTFRCSKPGYEEVCSLAKPSGAGEGHVCGLDPVGQPRCMGEGSLPRAAAPAEGGFTRVWTSSTHACALHEDRYAVCWGDSGRGQAPGRIDRVVDVAIGPGWTCTLGTDGRVRCLGDAPALPPLPDPPPYLDARDWERRRRQ